MSIDPANQQQEPVDPAPPAAPDIWAWEARLGSKLRNWSVASIAAGQLLATQGSRVGSPALVSFGRQNVGWGAVDLLLAVVGDLARGRRLGQVADPTQPELQAGEIALMRRLLLVNAGMDVAYIGTGKVIALLGWRRRVPGAPLPASVGHGAAVVLQGAFLLGFDAWHAAELSRAARWGSLPGGPVADEERGDD